MDLSKGILLIGLGVEYTKLAYNLTKSIKKHNPDLPICCLTDITNPELLDVFDKVIKPAPFHYLEDGIVFNPFKLKTYIYDYSPFQETIYLDVDAVCLKDISSLFSNFKIQEVGRFSKETISESDCVWFKKDIDIFSLYNLENDYPEYNSSFVSFNKSSINESYFDLVKKMYSDRRFEFTAIGRCYPDEMAFGIASSKMEHYSDSISSPIAFWWYLKNKNASLSEVVDNYYFIGLAGGHIKGRFLGYYHVLIKQLSPHWNFQMKNKIFHKK
jgi:hypothetical protein